MPARRRLYRRGALYLLKEDQWGSHRHAAGLIFYWLAPRELIFYWLAPPSSLSLLAGSSWGQPVKPCRVEVEEEVEEEEEEEEEVEVEAVVPGWLGPTQIAQSPVWEKHTTLFPPPEPRQTEFLLSLLSPFAPHFLSSVPPSSLFHCFDLMTHFTLHLLL